MLNTEGDCVRYSMRLC